MNGPVSSAVEELKAYLAKCEQDYATGDHPVAPEEAIRTVVAALERVPTFKTEHELIVKAITWGGDRLHACDRTARESRSKESRDWAYGESVAIRVMLAILAGKDVT